MIYSNAVTVFTIATAFKMDQSRNDKIVELLQRAPTAEIAIIS
jgi:hypothetical protein